MNKEMVPKEYICPLTKIIMVDPLMSRYEVSYVRAAIIDHITNQSKAYCPRTKKPLSVQDLVTNYKLRVEIFHYRRNVLGEDSSTTYYCNDLYDDALKEMECIRTIKYTFSPPKHPKKGLMANRRSELKNLLLRFSSGSCNSNKI